MKLFSNFMGELIHETDRPPQNQEDLNYLVKMFPSAVVSRKSNTKSIQLNQVKIRNIHWYQ